MSVLSSLLPPQSHCFPTPSKACISFSSPSPVTLQCKILKCNSDFWAATSGGGADSEADVEFCAALREYSNCVTRTARTCRGDLAFHLAQHGIEDLMTQNNCSKEGPTASPRPRHPPQRPLPPFQPQLPPQHRPPLLPPHHDRDNTPEPDVCHYERRLASSSPRGGGQPNYTHCGFFGDPHLRTFTDDFQTCKVEGAWPLVHNKYLSVQVTNTPVVPGSAATATSKVRTRMHEPPFVPLLLSWLTFVHHLPPPLFSWLSTFVCLGVKDIW